MPATPSPTATSATWRPGPFLRCGSRGERANHYVDITETFDRKKAALRAHVSQMVEIEDLDGLLEGWNGMNAKLAGMPEGHFAEAFWVMDTA